MLCDVLGNIYETISNGWVVEIAGGIIFIGMIKLKNILQEDEVEDNFGKVAFGEIPKFVKMQGKKREENTEFEEQLLILLRRWAKGFTPESSSGLYTHFNLFKKASKKFPSIFLPETPNGTEIYRGLQDADTLIPQLKETKPSEWKKWKRDSLDMRIYSNPIEYTPNRDIQSWTTNLDVAINFANKRDSGWAGNSPILLLSKQTDEFLFSQKVMTYMWGRNESEILHFGKKYKEKVYVIIPEFMFKRHVINRFDWS